MSDGFPEAKKGMIGVQKKFQAVSENGRFEFGTERNREFITILLGAKEKDHRIPSDNEIKAMLFDMGFVSQEDILHEMGDQEGYETLTKIRDKVQREIEEE